MENLCRRYSALNIPVLFLPHKTGLTRTFCIKTILLLLIPFFQQAFFKFLRRQRTGEQIPLCQIAADTA